MNVLRSLSEKVLLKENEISDKIASLSERISFLEKGLSNMEKQMDLLLKVQSTSQAPAEPRQYEHAAIAEATKSEETTEADTVPSGNLNPGTFFFGSVSNDGFSYGNDLDEVQALFVVYVPEEGDITYKPLIKKFNRFKNNPSLIQSACDIDGDFNMAQSMSIDGDGILKREGNRWVIISRCKVSLS